MRVYFAFIMIFLFGGIAQANPNANYYLEGSSFKVRASNPDQRSWNCSIAYTLEHQDWDEPAKQETFNRTFVVPVNYNGVVLDHPTGWAASKLKIIGSG